MQIQAQSGQKTREQLERNELNDGLKTGKNEVLSVKKSNVRYYHYVKHNKLLMSYCLDLLQLNVQCTM
jgi:hypothetical protein